MNKMNTRDETVSRSQRALVQSQISNLTELARILPYEGVLYAGSTRRSKVTCWFFDDGEFVKVEVEGRRTLKVFTEPNLTIELEDGRWIAVHCANKGDYLRYSSINPLGFQ